MLSLWLCWHWLRTPPFHIRPGWVNVGFIITFWSGFRKTCPRRPDMWNCSVHWHHGIVCLHSFFDGHRGKKMYGAVTGTDEDGNDLLSATKVPEKKVCVDPAFFADIQSVTGCVGDLFIPFSETKGTRGKVLRLWNYMAKMRPRILSSRKITLKFMELFISASTVK